MGIVLYGVLYRFRFPYKFPFLFYTIQLINKVVNVYLLQLVKSV